MDISLDTILGILGILGVIVTALFGWYKFRSTEKHIEENSRISARSSLVIELEKELVLFRDRLKQCELQCKLCDKQMEELRNENRNLMRDYYFNPRKDQ